MLGILKRNAPAFLALAALVMMGTVSASSVRAQDPSGRPSGRSRRHRIEKPKEPPPEKITILLTVITDPPGCEVFLNDENRGTTDNDGKLKIDKLALGGYKVEIRKHGYVPANKSFQAGTDTPTLVFKLVASLDEEVKKFDSLVVAGKLVGPANPNAFDFVQELSTKYPGRAEVTKIRSVLAQKLIQSSDSIADDTEHWREVKRKLLVSGKDISAAAVFLVPDDKSAVRLSAYLSAALALRDWENSQSGGDSHNALLATASNGFQKAAEINGKWAFGWYQLGRSRLLSNDWNGAQTAFSRCIELDPGSIEAHLGLASAYYGQGGYKEAIAEYQKIIVLDGNNSPAYAGMGLARAASGKTKDGIRDVERAAQLKPDSGLPNFNLGLIYSKSKKKKEREAAIEQLRTAIGKNKDGLEFPNRVAQSLLSELEGGDKKK